MDKKKIRKMILKYFLAMFVLTILSNSLTNMALPQVDVEGVKSNSLKFQIKSSGKLTAVKNVLVEGVNLVKIDNILVREGQKVEKGQNLVELNKDSVDELFTSKENEVEIAKLDYEIAQINKQEGLMKAEIEYNQAKKKYEDNLVLFENGAVSKNELEKSKADLELSELDLKNKTVQNSKEKEKEFLNAKQLYNTKNTEFEKIKKIKNDNYYIKAPTAGVVNNIYARIGVTMGENEKLLDIKDRNSGFELRIVIPKQVAKYVEIGEKMKASALGDLEIEAEVKGIVDDKEDPENKKEVCFLLNNDLLAGDETVTINAVKTSKIYDMVIPKSAVGKEATGETFVWKIRTEEKSFGKEFYVEKALVTISDEDLKSSAIASGLAFGDKVVGNAGELDLKENGRVIEK